MPRLRLGSLFSSLPARPTDRAGAESGAGGGEQSKEARREGRRERRTMAAAKLSLSRTLVPLSIDARQQSKSTPDLFSQQRKQLLETSTHSPAGARAGLGAEEAGEACLLVEGAGEERHGCDRGVWFFWKEKRKRKRRRVKEGEPAQQRRFNFFVVVDLDLLSSLSLFSRPPSSSSFPPALPSLHLPASQKNQISVSVSFFYVSCSTSG